MWKIVFELFIWTVGAIILVYSVGWAVSGGVILWFWANNMQMRRLWREDIDDAKLGLLLANVNRIIKDK